MAQEYKSEEMAKAYDKFKSGAPFKVKLELPTIQNLVGDELKGKRVLDMGCGAGDSTRTLALLGPPAELIGMDLSAEMINKAREKTPEELKITFIVNNIVEPHNLGQFDVVFLLHVIHFADTESNLLKFYQSIYDSVKEDGFASGVMINPFQQRQELTVPDVFRKYGMVLDVKMDQVWFDVSPVNSDGEKMFTSRVYLWPASLHEECIRKAGFKRVEWIKPSIDENESVEYWKEMLNYLTGFKLYK